jgi:hypothetical protein
VWCAGRRRHEDVELLTRDVGLYVEQPLPGGERAACQLRLAGGGEGVFQVAPDPLARVQFETVRRLAHQAQVGREREPLGGMRATSVQPQAIEAVRYGSGGDRMCPLLSIRRPLAFPIDAIVSRCLGWLQHGRPSPAASP